MVVLWRSSSKWQRRVRIETGEGIRIHARALRCSARFVGGGGDEVGRREKPRRSEKWGEGGWVMVGCALERVEWVRGVSFEPLNFAKFETVRGRWRTHPLTCIRLSPFFFLPFYAPLRFSLPLFFSPHSRLSLSVCFSRTRYLTPSPQPLRLEPRASPYPLNRRGIMEILNQFENQ